MHSISPIIEGMTDQHSDLSNRLQLASELFYDQVFSDPMIGFMFSGLDAAHLAQREYELMAMVPHSVHIIVVCMCSCVHVPR